MCPFSNAIQQFKHQFVVEMNILVFESTYPNGKKMYFLISGSNSCWHLPHVWATVAPLTLRTSSQNGGLFRFVFDRSMSFIFFFFTFIETKRRRIKDPAPAIRHTVF